MRRFARALALAVPLGGVGGLAAGAQDPPTAASDPAVLLCDHLIRSAVRTASTYERETVTFGRMEDERGFAAITFTALAQNGYLMHGRAECRFRSVAPTPGEEVACARCRTYVFDAFVFQDNEIVMPQPLPRITTGESALPG